jgi:hypothetical protein
MKVARPSTPCWASGRRQRCRQGEGSQSRSSAESFDTVGKAEDAGAAAGVDAADAIVTNLERQDPFVV